MKFQIKCLGYQYIVDLDEKTSRCRKWVSMGFHAISAISFNKEKVEAYVDGYYSVDTQRKIYKERIHPINGENSWLEFDYKPLPP